MMALMNVVAFVISLALFIAGLFIMGSAFALESNHALVFFAGIIVTSLGVAVPIHVLKRIDA